MGVGDLRAPHRRRARERGGVKRVLTYEESALLDIMTQVKGVAAIGYADLMESRRRIDWRVVNAALSSRLSPEGLHEIQREAHRIVLSRNGRVAARIEAMRFTARGREVLPCETPGCKTLIRPGDWLFWKGVDRESGFICEACATIHAIEEEGKRL